MRDHGDVTDTETIRVFLLDDHEVVRRGLRELLEPEGDLEVVGEAGSASEALARIPALRPDVAVLDARLPDGSGIDVCRDIRSSHPEIRALILTSFDDDDALFAAIMAGAAGYVLKDIHGDDLVDAIRRVRSGQSLLDPAVTGQVLERLRNGKPEDKRLASLSDQERRMLSLIGEGLTNRQIAEQMFLAEKTVKNYGLEPARQAGHGAPHAGRDLLDAPSGGLTPQRRASTHDDPMRTGPKALTAPRSAGHADGMGKGRVAGDGTPEELSRAECLRLLRSRSLGRVAYTDHALPAIAPVNYAVDGDTVVFRTATGTRLAAGTRDAVVAFEVDESDPVQRWGWSVVVVGVASEVLRTSAGLRAVELALAPWAAGERNHFVRITPTFVSGRRINRAA